ncbi:isochorismate synthase MenF [Nonomuraea sp. NPDC049400]|uniref:isochorismate synthase MenF n=1 Tax=Nonomuraea sp. NPDC049400 TaxID=3364352 RepID=UPI0037959736
MSHLLLPPKAPTVADHVAAPIRDYRPGNVLISGLDHTLLARGGLTFTGVSLAELPGAVAGGLDERGGGVALGAISFDGQSCRMIFADDVSRYDPLPARPCFRCGHASWELVPSPNAAAYVAAVRRARDRIIAGEADKVVLARALTAISSRPISLTDLLIHLGGRGRHVYAVPLGRGRSLVGASPELLISRRGRTVTTNPLAGSARRHPHDPAADLAAADGLLASAKDQREHHFVVQQVAAALAPFCDDLQVPEQPQVQATPTLWHLGTTITATLTDPATTALHLAAALHPTPAICGTPTAAARALITELESGSGVERGWYGGLVGWQDADGDGEWAITLRCAVVDSRRARLWAGAGIIADSDPEAELAETEAKLATLLHALHAN